MAWGAIQGLALLIDDWGWAFCFLWSCSRRRERAFQHKWIFQHKILSPGDETLLEARLKPNHKLLQAQPLGISDLRALGFDQKQGVAWLSLRQEPCAPWSWRGLSPGGASAHSPGHGTDTGTRPPCLSQGLLRTKSSAGSPWLGLQDHRAAPEGLTGGFISSQGPGALCGCDHPVWQFSVMYVWKLKLFKV